MRDSVEQLRTLVPADNAAPAADAGKAAEDLRRHATGVAEEAKASSEVIVLVMLLYSSAILVIVFNSYLVINVPIRNLVERTKDIAEGQADRACFRN